MLLALRGLGFALKLILYIFLAGLLPWTNYHIIKVAWYGELMGGFSQGAQERSTCDLGFELEALNEPSVLKETLCLVKRKKKRRHKKRKPTFHWMVVVADQTWGLFNASFSPFTTVLSTGAPLLFVWEEDLKVNGILKCFHPVPWATREYRAVIFKTSLIFEITPYSPIVFIDVCSY